jgi:quercetin dioxygenase-like cupin family protein
MKKNGPIFTIQIVSLAVLCTLRVAGQTKPLDTRKVDTTKYTIDTCLNEFSKDKIEKTDAGYQYWFVNKNLADGRTLKMSVVKPHSATHAPHSHAEEEFFFVLEGTVEFSFSGRTKVVGPFSSLYCPPNVEHGIRNVGESEAKYLVVKKYEKK